MSDPTEDQQCATQLALNAEYVGQVRNNFYQTPEGRVMLAIFENRMRRHVEEKRRKYDSVTPDNLKQNQGEIRGLELAITCLTNTA